MIREVNLNLKYLNPEKSICEYRNFALVNKKTNNIDIVYKFIDEYINYKNKSYVIYMKITNSGMTLPYIYESYLTCREIVDFDKYYIIECDIENMKTDIDVSLKRDGD